MSYIVPSVLVYQQLANSGGIANATPDLEGCIIGPCNNVVIYDTTSSVTLAASMATLTAGGAPAVAQSLSNTLTVYLPSTKLGQLVDSTSVGVYADNAIVTTGNTKANVPISQTNILNIGSAAGLTASTTNNSATVTMSAGTFYVNDVLTITGAGQSGADLVATVTAVNVLVLTLSAPAKATLAAAPSTRTGFYNINTSTSTNRLDVGDLLSIVTAGGTTFTTKVLSYSSSGGVITQIKTTDIIPSGFAPGSLFTLVFQKVMDNLLVPATYNLIVNYTIGNVTIDGSIVINPTPTVAYGTIAVADIHAVYSALRTDLAGQIIDIPDEATLLATLGPVGDTNPLALGVQIALSNTTTSIKCIAVSYLDLLVGYTAAFQLAENQRLYALTVLTQRIDILEALQVHVEGMSTPENASWRVGFVNTLIPAVSYIGLPTPDNPSTNNTMLLNTALSPNAWTLVDTSANGTFITNGVLPGDTVNIIHSVDGSSANANNYTMTVASVKSNQELVLTTPPPKGSGTGTYTAVSYYVSRTLSASQQATIVAGASTTFGSSRIYHVQPDLCGVVVNGVTKFLPGYYLCCALVGLTAGLPAQKGLTNIGIAGIVDLQHSNFYFTRAQLNQMAGAGTLLLVQESQGSLPYVRHSLSTDMSVLQYRELQQVKNIDFVSYFFYDILKSFPGRFNITPDTLQTLRATITAGGKLLQGKPLPKIGPPLLDFTIKTLEQDANNKDQVNVVLPIVIPTVMNYVNIYLVV